jgi:CheY-specific phosphatase CheX
MATELYETIKKAFFNSTMFTFDKMLMISLEPKPVEQIDATSFEISGVIGFSGGVMGNCALRITAAGAQELVTRIAGEAIESPAEIADGVGEIVNMIAGNAKAALADYVVTLSFPEVIRGKGHEIGFHRHSDIVTFGFSSEIGDCIVIVAYSDPSK